ncbi:MAG: hypothetical protein JWR72_186 [Flavisolibacter sp.]|jgi:hypothetical protein|nr:hypothetical protein [Flavisolibacter sp.]
MKLTKKIALTFIASGLLFMAGCKKDLFDINSNPDAVTDASVTPAVLLPGALQNTSRIVATDWSFLNAWMGYWARSGSYQSLTEEETYKFTNDFQVQIWNDLYANNTNYNIMVNKARATGAGFYEAIGRIMKAHNFGILVDVYGNVPYSEAFKGTEVATPKYDKGIDIYKDLFKELDGAVALLKNASAIEAAKNPDIAASDLVYAGNAASWIRFANTLRLRLLIHLYNGLATNQVVPGIDVNAEIAKTTADGFIGAGQSAHLNPGFSATKPNPYYRAYVENEAGTQTGDVWRAGKYAIDYYKYNGDPRINRFYVSPNGTTAGQTGIVFGTPAGAGVPIGSALSTVRGPGLIPNGAASRAWIITSVESLFLQAEARHRGLLTIGTASALLTTAVRESFVWLGLTSANADAYLSSNAGYPDVDYNGPWVTPAPAGGGLFTILSQKWFALNSIATYEVWTDYRRTDYVLGSVVGYTAGPPISVDPGNTSTRIPRRLLYPQNEYNYNPANVGAEGTVNVFNNKVFWDLN